MKKENFDSWIARKELSEVALTKINAIRNSDPARRVKSWKRNVSGIFPSNKMGVGIQFESHQLELASCYEKEMDSNVLEFYDQPNQLKIKYPDKNGSIRSRQYTPDFFVISEDWIGWEEWKEEEELKRLAVEKPYLYMKDNDNKWRNPPAEEKAKEFGLAFRVRSSAELNWVFLRNVIFLEEYFRKPGIVSDATKNLLLELVKQSPTIKLDDLLYSSKEIYSSDDVYQMIANNEIIVDLYSDDLMDGRNVSLHTSIESLDAYRIMQVREPNGEKIQRVSFELKKDGLLQWGLEIFLIKMVFDDKIYLEKDEDIYDFNLTYIENLILKGEIKGVPKKEETNEELELKEILLSADSEIIEEALRRYKYVKRIINGEDYSDIEIPKRTLARWVSNYKTAEEIYNLGLVGLYNEKHLRGNKLRKREPEVIDLMDEFIEKIYETKRQKSKKTTHNQLVLECKKRGFEPPSYNTFVQEINNRPIHEQTLKRKGKRAAYDTEEREHLYLDVKTPRHGSRPFEIVHIDHTQLDIELLSKDGENFGRPYVTFAIDAFCRKIFAFYLTYDAPSNRSSMMVLREMVRRYKRMPVNIVVDGGKEFQSEYFEQLLVLYNVTKKNRPPAKSRFGSIVERMFGTNNTQFIHNLIGNTQITKNVRQVTKSFNPRNNAVWTIKELYMALEEYLYEIYDEAHHTTLGKSPNEMYLRNIAVTGERKNVFITNFDAFKIITMPSASKQKRTVQANEGVKINGFYYWSKELDNPEYHRKKVYVRYDPFNMGKAYAYLKHQWVELWSEYYALLTGITEKEIKIISQELKHKNKVNGIKKNITAKRIAEFLYRKETTEKIEVQRKKDREMKDLLTVIEGGKTNKNDKTVIENKGETKDKVITTMGDKRRKELREKLKNKELTAYEEFE